MQGHAPHSYSPGLKNMRRRSTGGERRRQQHEANKALVMAPASDQGPLKDADNAPLSSRSRLHAQLFHPSGQTQVYSASPMALTPGISPMYRHHGVHAAGHHVSAAREALDESIGLIYTTCLPAFFDALAKYQYQQALSVAEYAEPTDWKNWDVLLVMIKLIASSESTYHLMKYLEPDMVKSHAIDKMYSKVIVLMNHLAGELRPMAHRQRYFQASSTPVGHESRNSVLEPETNGDLNYYAELLDQGAEFFSLRLPMIKLYRLLAGRSEPRDFSSILKLLDGLVRRLEVFDHPLLEIMKQSAMEEVCTVRSAIQTEIQITEYNVTKSIISLHRLKSALRSWSDHIDSLSEYPLFGEFDGDVDDDYSFADSVYSNVTPSNMSSSMLSIPPTLLNASTNSYSDSFARHNSGRKSQVSSALEPIADSNERKEETLTKQYSAMSIESSVSNSTEAQTAFSKLLSHGSMLKRHLSVSNVTNLVAPHTARYFGLGPQKAGDPYFIDETIPSNGVEQGLLGGPATPMSTVAPAEGANGNAFAADPSGATSRDEGFALPVFQWSKRFFRSLVAKFSLYFHRWLEPLEKQGDFLSCDLTRFIRNPLEISYLQLMDVLLARGAYRSDDSQACIMLVLETDQLEDKGAHYYQNGYLCPSSSQATPTGDDEPPTRTRLDRSKSMSTSPMMSPHLRRSMTSVPATSHSLFVHVEDEDEDPDFSALWGLRSWPAVFCYPQKEAPLQHWPNIISLIMDNRHALQTSRSPNLLEISGVSVNHFEKRMKTVYYISQVDHSMFLVLVLEGKRRPNEKTTQDFMQTLTENLQHSGVFEPGMTVPTVSS